MSALLAVAAAAPQVYHGVRPAGYGYAAGQTSHQSVTKADGEVRSVQVTILILSYYHRIVALFGFFEKFNQYIFLTYLIFIFKYFPLFFLFMFCLWCRNEIS